jgi:hypothetical protein
MAKLSVIGLAGVQVELPDYAAGMTGGVPKIDLAVVEASAPAYLASRSDAPTSAKSWETT